MIMMLTHISGFFNKNEMSLSRLESATHRPGRSADAPFADRDVVALVVQLDPTRFSLNRPVSKMSAMVLRRYEHIADISTDDREL